MPRVKEDDVQNKKRRLFLLDIPTRPQEYGNVLVCGQGDMGQLGLGYDDTMHERKRPALLPKFESAVDVVAGGMHSLVLTSDGIVYSFGCNDEGALGRDCSKEGSDFTPDVINLPDKVVQISAGDSHSACLLEDGRVFSWGSFRDSHGNMGLTLEGNKFQPIDVLKDETCCSISSGSDHLVMLTTKGKVYTVGCGEQGQLGRVSLRSASGEGRRGKTELLRPGLLFMRGQLIKEIWTSNYCTFMRSINDTIWAFGLNNYKQVLVSKKVDAVITPTKINLTDVNFITGGQHHTLVLKNDNTCHSIGRVDYGRLGLGKLTNDVEELQQVKALADIKITKIAAGEAQSFALTSEGKVYSWGMGSNHQLGLGVDDDALEPTLIESVQTLNKRILQVSSGGQHTIFIVAVDKNNTDKEDVPVITKNKPAATTKKTKSEKETIVAASTNKDKDIAVPNKQKMTLNGESLDSVRVELIDNPEPNVSKPKESAPKENGNAKRGRKRK